jgi:hypothetical protein
MADTPAEAVPGNGPGLLLAGWPGAAGTRNQVGCARRNRPKWGTVNAISPRSEL